MRADLDIGVARPQEMALALDWAADVFEGFKELRQLRKRQVWARDHIYCFVARADEVVTSSLFALELPVYWPVKPGSSELTIRTLVGITTLITPPEFQGQGHASSLLGWTFNWARSREAVACALFSEIGPRYYERLGYVAVPMPYHWGAMPVLQFLEARAAGRRPGRPFRLSDLSRAAEAYTAAASRYPLAVARGLEYWRHQLAWLPFNEELHSTERTGRDFVVGSDGLRAYLRSRHDEDVFAVLEAVCLPGAEDELAGLVWCEMLRAAREGCVRVLMHLPPAMPLLQGLDLKLGWSETFMVRSADNSESDGILSSLGAGERPYLFRPDYF